MSDQLVAATTHTTHKQHKRQTSISVGEFELTIQQASGRRPTLYNPRPLRSAHSAHCQIYSVNNSKPFFPFFLIVGQDIPLHCSPFVCSRSSIIVLFVANLVPVQLHTHYSSNVRGLTTSYTSMCHMWK